MRIYPLNQPRAKDICLHADIGMSWRNSGNEVIIEALCPKELQPKDLKCTFTTNTLILEVAGKEIATGKLFGPIKPDESTWQFGERSDRGTAKAVAEVPEVA